MIVVRAAGQAGEHPVLPTLRVVDVNVKTTSINVEIMRVPYMLGAAGSDRFQYRPSSEDNEMLS